MAARAVLPRVSHRFFVFSARRFLDVDIPEIENLQEVRTVLAERVKDWTKQWREEGREEGLQAGEAAVLRRLVESKFGSLDSSFRRLPAAVSDWRSPPGTTSVPGGGEVQLYTPEP